MTEVTTISPERHQLGIQACYELEGIAETLRRLAHDEASGGEHLDCELVRGMAIRAKALIGVTMATFDNDVDEADAYLTVYGEPLPEARIDAAGQID